MRVLHAKVQNGTAALEIFKELILFGLKVLSGANVHWRHFVYTLEKVVCIYLATIFGTPN
jgi:hypothetical protein